LYYNPFISSRAATILYHNKQAVEVMWGRLLTLLTCGRLAIGQLPVTSDTVCGLPLCGAGWHPAAGWQPACRPFARRSAKPITNRPQDAILPHIPLATPLLFRRCRRDIFQRLQSLTHLT
jgi:hypothetical protein